MLWFKTFDFKCDFVLLAEICLIAKLVFGWLFICSFVVIIIVFFWGGGVKLGTLHMFKLSYLSKKIKYFNPLT